MIEVEGGGWVCQEEGEGRERDEREGIRGDSNGALVGGAPYV